LNDPLNAVFVDRVSLLGAIQIHNVKKGRPLIYPMASHRRRVAAIDGFLSVVSLTQSHALPGANVDGGKDEHF
jgi:hypothetical protein